MRSRKHDEKAELLQLLERVQDVLDTVDRMESAIEDLDAKVERLLKSH